MKLLKKLQINLKIILALLGICTIQQIRAQDTSIYLGPEHSIYQFTVKDIDGNDFEFSCLEGKKILIVNTGSKCMYRKQLGELQELYQKYKDNDFVVVVFPSNDFYGREPKGNSHIKKVYNEKYGIDFPIMAKTHVKGKEISPIYDFLSFKIKNGKFDIPPKWNFHKYLIDRQGYIETNVNPGVSPLDKQIIDWINKD